MIQLSTEYSIAWTILCGIVSFLFAYWLYRNSPFSKKWSAILALLRFFTVFLLSFFLLNPFLNFEIVEKEKPIVVFAIDNSASMVRSGDSLFLKKELSKQIDAFTKENIDDFKIDTYTFGESTKLNGQSDFSDKKTDISQLISDLNANYSNRNICALTIVSDGLYNYGKNPNYQSFDFDAPIYSLAVGDTSVYKDVKVNYLFHNDLAFLGNTFPIKVNLHAQFYKNKKTQVQILQNDILLDFKDVIFDSDDQVLTVPFSILAKDKGIQEYEVFVRPLEQEKNTINNRAKVFIDVLESKQKILLLTEVVHPDIAAISKAISSNQNFDLTIINKSEFDGNFSPYNLIIAYQTPVEVSDIPVWHFFGQNTTSSNLQWINFQASSNTEEVSVYYNNFSLFNLDEQWDNWFKQLPPLYIAMANYKSQGEFLFSQSIRGFDLNEPILVFNSRDGVREAAFIGEGLWRWRINEFKDKQTHFLFDELINKSVQYLVLNEDKRPFRLKAKNKIFENESFFVELDFYNSNYELVNDVDVAFKLLDESNNEFDYIFDKSNKSYQLEIKDLAVGNYTYKASAIRNDKIFSSEGTFKVVPLQLEILDDQHKHEVLKELSEKNGGELFYLKELNVVFDKISKLEKNTIIYTKNSFSELIHSKWIALFLFVFLTLEWILRKINNNI